MAGYASGFDDPKVQEFLDRIAQVLEEVTASGGYLDKLNTLLSPELQFFSRLGMFTVAWSTVETSLDAWYLAFA